MITRKRSGSCDILSVRLQETWTLTLYQQDNESVDIREVECNVEVERWNIYLEKKQKRIVRIRDVSSQTTPRFSVDKNTQKPPVDYKNSEALVTLSDMHDEFQKLIMESESKAPKRGIVYKRAEDDKNETFLGDFSELETDEERVGKKSIPKKGVNAYDLLTSLGWIERMLSSSQNLDLIYLFAGERDSSNVRRVSMHTNRAKITELWTFTSQKCHAFRVNCITFFKSTPWLLVAGCGNLTFGEKGALVGWNVKKIKQPEVWIEMPSAVTAVSSCPDSPQFCAAAMLDGSIRVYQLDQSVYALVLDTCGSPEKHFAPVWWIEWRDSQIVNSVSKVDAEEPSFKTDAADPKADVKCEIAQVLVSASEDGTVKEWLFTSEEGLLACCTLLRIYLPLWLSGGDFGDPTGEAKGPPNISESSKEAEKKSLSTPASKNPSQNSSTKSKSAGESNKNQIKDETPSKSGAKNAKSGIEKPSEVSNLDSIGNLLSSQLVPATCIGFRAGSKTDYLLGTVSGDVLLCRTFERDRVRQIYRGHTGRISHVSWRPSGDELSTIFMSAALDETIRIWHIDKPDIPLCTMKIPKAKGGGYLDAKWCPWYANLLGGIHNTGLHLWDVSLSSHSPALKCSIPDATCASFSPLTRNVLVGDKTGAIHVIHLQGLQESSSKFLKCASGVSKLVKINA